MSDVAFPYAKYDGDRRSSWERLTWIDAGSGYAVRTGKSARKDNESVIQIPVIGDESKIDAGEGASQYPRWLIKLFAGGLLIAILGIVLICFATFAKSRPANSAGGILAAVGAVSVALAIFRGQDIEDRHA